MDRGKDGLNLAGCVGGEGAIQGDEGGGLGRELTQLRGGEAYRLELVLGWLHAELFCAKGLGDSWSNLRALRRVLFRRLERLKVGFDA